MCYAINVPERLYYFYKENLAKIRPILENGEKIPLNQFAVEIYEYE